MFAGIEKIENYWSRGGPAGDNDGGINSLIRKHSEMRFENLWNTEFCCRRPPEAGTQLGDRRNPTSPDLHEIGKVSHLPHHSCANHADPDVACHSRILKPALGNRLGRHMRLAQKLSKDVHHRLMDVFNNTVVLGDNVDGHVSDRCGSTT